MGKEKQSYYTIVVSLIGIVGLLIFGEGYTIFAIVCFMAIIFEDGVRRTKNITGGGSS